MRHDKSGLLATLLIAGAASVNAQAPVGSGADAQRNTRLAQAPADQPLADYDKLLQDVAALQVYNQLLETQIRNQEQTAGELRTSIEQVPDLDRQIAPLLIRMVDGLAQFIKLDVPFEPDVRAERLANLQAMIERTDVNNAEKFRRVLEAWQIENEYGNDYGTYVGQLDIDGATREVAFLRVGRVALLYQTSDGELTGAWDQRSRQWVPLGSQYRNSVRQAIRMARNQVAPDLVLIPVLPPSP